MERVLYVCACAQLLALRHSGISPAPDVECVNFLEQTPLHIASRRNNVDVARVLLHAGASVSACDAQGLTAFATAAVSGGHAVCVFA